MRYFLSLAILLAAASTARAQGCYSGVYQAQPQTFRSSQIVNVPHRLDTITTLTPLAVPSIQQSYAVPFSGAPAYGVPFGLGTYGGGGFGGVYGGSFGQYGSQFGFAGYGGGFSQHLHIRRGLRSITINQRCGPFGCAPF
jgi:hypothetical protein